MKTTVIRRGRKVEIDCTPDPARTNARRDAEHAARVELEMLTREIVADFYAHVARRRQERRAARW